MARAEEVLSEGEQGGALARHRREGFQIDAVEELAVQRELQLLVLGCVAFVTEQAIYPARFTISGPLYRFS